MTRDETMKKVNKVNLILSNSRNTVPEHYDSDQDMSEVDLSEG